MKIQLTIVLGLMLPFCLLGQIGQTTIGESDLAESRQFQTAVAAEVVPAPSNVVSNCCFGGNQTPLPPEFAYFQASLNESQHVDLNWEITNETNNSHFEVEHSIDGINFETIDKVLGQGMVSATTAYNSKHTEPVAGTNYYRLKQVDLGGSYSFSHVEAVDIPHANHTFFQVYPNPTSGVITVQSGENAIISVLDIYGRVLMQQPVDNQQSIDISQLSNGFYILQMEQQGTLEKLVLVKQ